SSSGLYFERSDIFSNLKDWQCNTAKWFVFGMFILIVNNASINKVKTDKNTSICICGLKIEKAIEKWRF
ncbi:MAG: hypothetical protein ACXV9T_12175, partial [Methylobacter sp.]